jgi:hypothetical protein
MFGLSGASDGLVQPEIIITNGIKNRKNTLYFFEGNMSVYLNKIFADKSKKFYRIDEP